MYRTLSVAGLVYLFLIGRATAHEHHGEDIPDGQAVTAEPIVCFGMLRGLREWWTLMMGAGLDIMGTYYTSNRYLWPDLPHWDGPWGMLPSAETIPITRHRLTRICTDCPIAMACTCASLRRRRCRCRLLSGPCPRRPSIRTQHSCRLRLVADAHAPSPNRTGCIPQAASDERHTLSHPSACCHRSRRCGQNHAYRELGTDALRWDHGPRLLSR